MHLTPGKQLDALQRRRLTAAGYLARAGSKARARELVEDARASASRGPEKARITLALAWWGLMDSPALVGALEGAMMIARSYGDAARFNAVTDRLLADLGV